VSGARAVRLIAMREIAERVRGRALRVMTVLTTLLVVAGIVVPAAIRGGTTVTTIGLVGEPAQSAGAAIVQIASSAGIGIVLVDVPSVGLANDELLRGTLDVALVGGVHGARALVRETLPQTTRTVLNAALDELHLRAALAAAGVPASQIGPALEPVPLATSALEAPPSDRAARDVAALAAGFLMYISLGLYGAAVAGGVAQEKTSRTAELLLAAVRPTQLLAGKVIGIGLVGLGQLSVAVGAGLIANAAVHSATIPSTVWALLPAFLAWFLAGFVLYAFAFAAAGALVARQEEVQFVTMPFGIVLVAGYLLVYAAIANPDATWLRVASLLPPLSASLMPARIALGHVPAWQIALDAALMLAAIRVTAALSARIYVGALVRGGARLSWRAALRLPQR
jgi:ABC-2 type transport system permease protein